MSRVLTLIGTALVLAVVITYAATSDLFVTADNDTTSTDRQTRKEAPSRVKLSDLRAATTAARFPGAPADASPQEATDGLVVRPLRMLKVFKKPAGRAFAKMPPKQFGDTWLPVIDRQAGWVRVLLPSRPNGSTGWLRKSGVELRTSPYLLRVHLGSRTLDINYEGDSIGTWPVAIGQARHPHTDRPDVPARLGRRQGPVLLTGHPAARVAQRLSRHLWRRPRHGRSPRLAGHLRVRVGRQSWLHPGPC